MRFLPENVQDLLMRFAFFIQRDVQTALSSALLLGGGNYLAAQVLHLLVEHGVLLLQLLCSLLLFRKFFLKRNNVEEFNQVIAQQRLLR